LIIEATLDLLLHFPTIHLMTKRLTTFTALTIAVLLMGASLSAQAQTKRVLCEEFTGTWCGWCPQGIWAIQNLDSAYGDKFIPVSFHNADPMAIPSGTDTLEQLISGFPTGWIDRTSYDGSTLNAGGDNTGELRAWNQDVISELALPVVADVNLGNITFDPKTRIVTATLSTKFYQDASGDMRVTLYVVEDSLSGPSGSTWDQHNYLSASAYPPAQYPQEAAVDTIAPWGHSPFHKMAGVLPGYVQMHVVREVVGGVWGIAGVIPQSATSGTTYTQTFTFVLPPYIRPDHTNLVGFAFNYNGTDITQNAVLNAAMAKLTTLPIISSTISNAITVTAPKPYITSTPSGATTAQLTVKNSSAAAVNVGVALDATGTSLLPGWTVTVSPNTLNVPANGSASATVTFNAPANAGYAQASFGVWPQVDGETSVGVEASIGALASNTKYACYGGDGFVTHGMPSQYAASFANIPFNTATVAAYPATTFDIGIFPDAGYLDLSSTASGPIPGIAPIVNQLLDANKKVFITSQNGMASCFDKSNANYTYCHTAAVTTLFNTKLGVKWLAETTQYNTTTGQLIPFDIAGVAGDPIGDGVQSTAIAPNTGTTDQFEFLNTNSSMTIYNTDDPTNPSGFKYESGQQRLAYLALSLSTIQDPTLQTSDTLVARTINWLLNGASQGVAPTQTKLSAFSANPNPFSASTNIRYVAAGNETNVQMSVIDILGREVVKLTPNRAGEGTYTATLSGANLATGSYHVVVHSSEGMHTIPVMIAR
jgi:hypothetical protein